METGGHISIIAMTAHAMQGDRERFMEAGMDDYVSKPIQPKELTAAIERVLQRKDFSMQKKEKIFPLSAGRESHTRNHPRRFRISPVTEILFWARWSLKKNWR